MQNCAFGLCPLHKLSNNIIVQRFQKQKKNCSSLFHSISIRIPTRIIKYYSIFVVHKNVRANQPARRVSAVNAICKDNDIFNKDCILLTDTL